MSQSAQEHLAECIDVAVNVWKIDGQKAAVDRFTKNVKRHIGTSWIAQEHTAIMTLSLATVDDPEKFREALGSFKV